ncbi:MAG: type III pantothenate kinase [Pseudomonadota bacterium]
MLLAIDIGNTNTVFAAYNGGALVKAWRCRTEATRSADEYAAFLNELFMLAKIIWDDFEGVIVSSVVPDANFHIREFCQTYLKQPAIMVDHDMVGIEVDLDRPQDVGADRLVNAVAVYEHYKTPAIVIDFGTATTFDVIDKDGAYVGGVIAPGINLSVSALHQGAAKLPSVSVKKTDKVLGKDTVGAIQSGIYWGYVSLIEGILNRLSDEMGEQPLVIATGGLASLFAEEIDMITEIDQDLTLKGLYFIYNKKKGSNVTDISAA